jgi:SAM-dependent methyltransferase
MGLYVDRILPWMLERVLRLPALEEQRVEALRGSAGRVLEVGFGSGASLPSYPAAGVQEIVGIDPNPGMIRRARRHQSASPRPVRLVRASGGALPFPDGRFDTVVTLLTLCSVPDPEATLREIRRVLRPGGRFLFLEHGLARDARLARWQRRLTPLHRLLAGGCRLDVPMAAAISASGFAIESLDRYETDLGPRVSRQMYRGVARVA